MINLAIMFVMVSVSPVKAMLMMVKTKIGDLVIVTLFVILFMSSDFLYIQNNHVFIGSAKKKSAKHCM